MTDKTTPIDPITHDDERVNIPTPELAPMMDPADAAPIKVAYDTRNPDLDPQLIWRGKDIDQTEITVDAPPIYLQEQVHPKAIIEDLRAGGKRNGEGGGVDLFDHFGITDEDREAEIEFYRHHRKWSNRMILGDGLQVMASLAEREGLKGQVQAIYIDPPYGIKFNSNFQWSTTSRDVKDGKLEHLTREPEQVKAFRDTWRDGIHSYLQYLRDRLVVARDLLTESGSCFVQIGDENVHRVRALMDEVFGEENYVSLIFFLKTSGKGSATLDSSGDYIVWYAKNFDQLKVKKLLVQRKKETVDDSYNKIELADGTVRGVTKKEKIGAAPLPEGRRLMPSSIYSDSGGQTTRGSREFEGGEFDPLPNYFWRTNQTGLTRLMRSSRIVVTGRYLRYKMYADDYPVAAINNYWDDVRAGGFGETKIYVVQTNDEVVARCLHIATDPGDLVLDPTCGSGTTAYVAEQWGRRWITIDTSRVALALARARIMGAKYPWYLLKDSAEGQKKEAEVTRSAPSTADTYNDIRHGFVYQRVPHITLKSIANNTEIDTIWEAMQPAVEEARAALNATLQGHPVPFEVETGGRKGNKIDFTASGEVELPSGEMAPANGFMEWEIPREAPDDWPDAAKTALQAFWEARIARQKEIDASIAAKADHEYLYDKPYEDKKRVRVAGPFTVESLSPHRTQAVNEHGELIDEADAAAGKRGAQAQEAENYREAILENLRKAGVQQADKADKITFTSLTPWPGEWLAAEGRYMEGETERKAGIFLGPEYGTLQRADLMAAAREAVDAGFDILITCAFNYDAHTAETRRLGRLPILQARMNPDLHMADDLKAGGGNLFVVFGEPDIVVKEEGEKLRIELLGVDIFKPATGEVVASEPDDIACWFIDTDYNEESFFVRHAYFPGAEIPYKQLKTTLKGEIDEEAWESLKRTVSRPFSRPKSGRIAVKVINHL
ncbi:site-specific DNA-methyltransferase [Lutimaribacter marinistellae]|uniref:site-specific DNA-methyltransferase (adenine-specific) n=1 Tax=Lutimaribacter marinistellae TaxID=1820329 RepID=A0ABV7THR2_9RHOB